MEWYCDFNTLFLLVFLLNILQKIFLFGLIAFVLTVSTPVAFSATLGDQWDSLKTSLLDAEKMTTFHFDLLDYQAEKVDLKLKDQIKTTKIDAMKKLQTAKTIYSDNFKDTALAVDAQSDMIITNALSDAENMLVSGDVEKASLNRQIIDKTIYKIAFMKMESAIAQNNSTDFLSWFNVMEKKFKISTTYPKIDSLVAGIRSNPALLSVNGPQITEKLLEIFKLKTVEELEEAIASLDKGDIQSAKTFTHEGLYYYRTLHPSVEEKLGSESANDLLHLMESALDVTTSDKSTDVIKAELKDISENVELIIRQYEGGDISEIGLALSGIKDRLTLVEIEYLAAVKDGKITNQVEYDETVVFLTKATEIFNNNKMTLMELSNSDVTSLEKNLADMNEIITAKGSTNEISILVGTSITNIATLQDLSGGETQIDILEYFDEIERLLNEAKTAYRSGNAQMAFDLVTQAYLDNYEFVEGPLGEVDSELVLKIEIDMRENLRDMIKSNESSDKVDAQIDMILSDLAQAKKVVPEFGTVTMMILAVAIVSIIGFTARSKISLGA
jgi:predicted secreted protein with PEFG-CTERM motif